jgi:hypothetical protein
VTDPLAVAGLTARCARHPEAPAVTLCARCGDQLCRTCLPQGSQTCAPCAARDPFHGVEPLPWERADRGPFRLLATLGVLILRPWSAALSFARGDVDAALRFAQRACLPLACISHVIPLTRTLLFEPVLQVRRIGEVGPADIAIDVARASGTGVLLAPLDTGLALLAVLLVTGFRDARAWVGHALYWSWLPPALMTYLSLVAWLAPPSLALALSPPLVALPMLWWFSLLFVARRARRASWPVAIAVALVGGAGWGAGSLLSAAASELVNPQMSAAEAP